MHISFAANLFAQQITIRNQNPQHPPTLFPLCPMKGSSIAPWYYFLDFELYERRYVNFSKKRLVPTNKAFKKICRAVFFF